jgi:hypothetical protein
MIEVKENVLQGFVDRCKDDGIEVPNLIKFDDEHILEQRHVYIDGKVLRINMFRMRGCKTPADFVNMIYDEYKKLIKEETKSGGHIVI